MNRIAYADFDEETSREALGPAGTGLLLLEGLLTALLSQRVPPPQTITLHRAASLPGGNHNYKLHVPPRKKAAEWSYCNHVDSCQGLTVVYGHLKRIHIVGGAPGPRGWAYREGARGLLGWLPYLGEIDINMNDRLDRVSHERPELWLTDYTIHTFAMLQALDVPLKPYGPAMLISLRPSLAVRYTRILDLVVEPFGTWVYRGPMYAEFRNPIAAGVLALDKEWQDAVEPALMAVGIQLHNLYTLDVVTRELTIVSAGPREAALLDLYLLTTPILPENISALVKAAILYSRGPYAQSLVSLLRNADLLYDCEGHLSNRVLAGLALATEYQSTYGKSQANAKKILQDFLLSCGPWRLRKGLENHLSKFGITAPVRDPDAKSGSALIGRALVRAVLDVTDALYVTLARPTKAASLTLLMVALGKDARIEIDPATLKTLWEICYSPNERSETTDWLVYYRDKE